MATFQTNYFVSLFEGPAGTLNINAASSDPLSRTLDDGDPGSTAFEPSDALTVDGQSRTYLGTQLINGETFVIVQTGSTYFAYGLVPDPATFDSTLSAGTFGIATLQNTAGVEVSTLCFAPGTLIATPAGEKTVETLQIGDLILTADGRNIPVRWIGRQTVVAAFAGDRARPVRIAAGALGNGLPHSDLILTADHALILDGLAINAGALVNGTTITRDPAPARATYYHIETEGHEVILANGAPAETYIDYVGRQAFDNHAEYITLYGDARIITEMPLPRVVSGRLASAALLSQKGGRTAA